MATEVKSVMSMSIDDLELSARTYGCLAKAGLLTVEDILLKGTSDLVGKTTLNEAYKALNTLGFDIKPSD